VEQLAHDNIAATQNLIKLAKATSCRKIIFFSTLSVYGDIQTESVHPKTPIINPDPYGLTKQVCELLISEYVSAVDGGAGIAIRLPGIVGKGAHRIWLSNVADALLSGNHIAAYNLDSAFNNAIHVEDLASFCHSLLGKNWRGFNTVTVGASGFLSVQETITLMASSLGISPKIKGIQSHKKNFTISNEHAIRIFDYEPSPISSIIKRYAQEVFSETKTNHPENPPSRKTS
jgi:nucleoside-diphosphate-sugar epimerase